MPCTVLGKTIICSQTTHQRWINFEHTIYLFEFSPRFGPAWFTVPGDKNIDVEPDGHMSFLWDIFKKGDEGG